MIWDILSNAILRLSRVGFFATKLNLKATSDYENLETLQLQWATGRFFRHSIIVRIFRGIFNNCIGRNIAALPN